MRQAARPLDAGNNVRKPNEFVLTTFYIIADVESMEAAHWLLSLHE